MRPKTIATALAESVYHRTAELREVGGFETAVQMRVYLADFRARFHDVRPAHAAWAPLYDPDDYSESQALTRRLLDRQAPTASSTGPCAIRMASAWPASARRWCARARRRPLRVSLGRTPRSDDSQALTVYT